MRLMNNPPIASGVAAGLVGTGVLLAAQSFDREYAPRTMPTNANSPDTTELARHLGAGVLTGLIYATSRVHFRSHSTLATGAVLGSLAYLAGATVFQSHRPKESPSKPIFPQIAGGLLRHTMSGVATAVAFEFFRRCAVSSGPSGPAHMTTKPAALKTA